MADHKNLVAVLVVLALAGQAPPPSPRAERAVGYYDAQLRRVVLVGGPAQAKAGERDRVWRWSGTHWELVSDSGPPSRANAAAAYDVGRGKAIVSGGSTTVSQ